MGGKGSGGRRLGAGRKKGVPSYVSLAKASEADRLEAHIQRKFELNPLSHRCGLAKFREMFLQSSGRCWICLREPKRKLCIDHNHQTGQVRGLLCARCNLALGYLDDNPESCLRAARYLSGRLWESHGR